MIKDYPDLGESVFEHRLSSGLLIRVVKKQGFSKIHAFLAVNYGSMDTKFEKNNSVYKSPEGVAHYLEHKMFDMPDGNVMQLFSQYGGSPNAFTSYDITAYYVECTDRLEDNLNLLLHYVSTPYFTQESVEKERGIIAQEIKMYEDSPDSRVYENLFASLYANHPIRNPIAGTVESIEEITAQTLYDCYHGFYVPQNMILCVVGDVNPALVVELAQKYYDRVGAPVSRRDYGETEKMVPVQKRQSCAMEVSMPMFAIGFKSEPAAFGIDSMKQEIIGELAAEILVGESSGLYSRLYKTNLIDSGFSCGYEGVRGMSILSASGDSCDPEAVCAAIIEEAQRIAIEGVDEKLFERLKRSALGRRVRDLDSFDSIAYRMCAYHFEGVEYFDFPEIFRQVDLTQISSFLKRTVTEERMALSVVNPK